MSHSYWYIQVRPQQATKSTILSSGNIMESTNDDIVSSVFPLIFLCVGGLAVPSSNIIVFDLDNCVKVQKRMVTYRPCLYVQLGRVIES